jgi:hypothetical protein
MYYVFQVEIMLEEEEEGGEGGRRLATDISV